MSLLAKISSKESCRPEGTDQYICNKCVVVINIWLWIWHFHITFKQELFLFFLYIFMIRERVEERKFPDLKKGISRMLVLYKLIFKYCKQAKWKVALIIVLHCILEFNSVCSIKMKTEIMLKHYVVKLKHFHLYS